MKSKYSLIFIICSLFFSFHMFSESEGEKYFKNNDPSRAVSALEKEISSGKISSDTYNFLGLAYSQLGLYDKACDAFSRGLNNPLSNKKILSFNRGNAYYAMGKYTEAAGCYSLAMAADPSFTKALLNRGNAYLMAQDYDNVITDYEKYLLLEPDDPQKVQIEEILALLKKKKADDAAEAERLAEEKRKQELEEQKIKEELARQEKEAAEKAEKERQEQLKKEEERLAEEKRLKEEEDERRRKLLEDVASQLQNSDSTNLSSGAEDIIDYDYESELD